MLPELGLASGVAVLWLHLGEASREGYGHLLDFAALLDEICQGSNSEVLHVQFTPQVLEEVGQ